MKDLRDEAKKKGIDPNLVFLAKLDDTKDFKGCLYAYNFKAIIKIL